MADFINVSLCVSDIPRDKIFVAENGKKYISICVSELRQPDQYENTHCVFIRQSKEERERKDARTYVGRGKSVIFRPAEPTPDQVSDLPVADNTDDLPFRRWICGLPMRRRGKRSASSASCPASAGIRC